jgi:hypothetical protein
MSIVNSKVYYAFIAGVPLRKTYIGSSFSGDTEAEEEEVRVEEGEIGKAGRKNERNKAKR